MAMPFLACRVQEVCSLHLDSGPLPAGDQICWILGVLIMTPVPQYVAIVWCVVVQLCAHNLSGHEQVMSRSFLPQSYLVVRRCSAGAHKGATYAPIWGHI